MTVSADEQRKGGYHIQFCGDTWFSANGQEAEKIRLWAFDGTLIATVLYVPVPDDPDARGTYRIEDTVILDGIDEDCLADWSAWQGAMEYAASYAASNQADWAVMKAAIPGLLPG